MGITSPDVCLPADLFREAELNGVKAADCFRECGKIVRFDFEKSMSTRISSFDLGRLCVFLVNIQVYFF